MLSDQQLAQFEEEGYLLLSGLIPQETVAKAEEAMWNMMGMEADNPDSWGHFKRPGLAGFYMERMSNGNRIELFGVTNPDVLACCTPDYLTVLKQLTSRYPDIPHCEDHRPDGIWGTQPIPRCSRVEKSIATLRRRLPGFSVGPWNISGNQFNLPYRCQFTRWDDSDLARRTAAHS